MGLSSFCEHKVRLVWGFFSHLCLLVRGSDYVYLLFSLCAMLLIVVAFLLTWMFSCNVRLELSMGMGESLGSGSLGFRGLNHMQIFHFSIFDARATLRADTAHCTRYLFCSSISAISNASARHREYSKWVLMIFVGRIALDGIRRCDICFSDFAVSTSSHTFKFVSTYCFLSLFFSLSNFIYALSMRQ